jgi:hypothetical protein
VKTEVDVGERNYTFFTYRTTATQGRNTRFVNVKTEPKRGSQAL